MSEATLQIVVVLYKARLRSLRPLLEAVRQAGLPARIVVNAVVNRDDLDAARPARRVELDPRFTLIVRHQGNAGGVAAAYNLALAGAAPDDIFVLLDADGRMPAHYFTEVWSRREELRSGLCFASPELFSRSMRISPFRLAGMVPVSIPGELERGGLLRFDGDIGVINSGLAGSAGAFRSVDGFTPGIGLDLSDVAWSLDAARRHATLRLLPIVHEHDLSILTRGFGFRRLKKYLVGCWRLGLRCGDAYGGLRLAARGFRALFVKGRAA